MNAVKTKEKNDFIEILYRNITTSLPQYVFWKDLNSVYLGCNKNYSNLLGLSSTDAIIGKTDADLNWQHFGHSADNFKQDDEATIAGNPITNKEEILSLPNGKTLITLVSKLPISENNKVFGIVGYFTDITELRNKEEKLIIANKQALVANTAKAAFIANLSHDIRTPLTGIIGMTKILIKELVSETGKEAAHNLLLAEHVLLDLLNEIVEIARLSTEKMPVYEMKFSMQKIIDDIVILIKPATQEKNLQLNISYDPNIPNYLLGDRTRIQRILLNLLSNAIKFTSVGKIELIVLLIEQNIKNVILKVLIKDTGIGISKDSQDIIFAKFNRLEPAYKGNYAGIGLGLYLVKQFIAEIEGEIEVESEEGQGSTFTCIIPLKKTLLNESTPINNLVSFNPICNSKDVPYQDNATNNTVNIQPRDPGKTMILVVEDNKIAQLAVKYLLEELNCEVTTADTGEIAIELFKKNKYSLIFMDIGLPGKDGYQTALEIKAWEKQHNQYTPIVGLSAHVDETNKQFLASGIEEMFSKPLKNEMATTILNTYVYQKNSKSCNH